MARKKHTPSDSPDSAATPVDASTAPKSALEKLRDAFSQMTGGIGKKKRTAEVALENVSEQEQEEEDPGLGATCAVTPKTILEAMLFVGHPQNEPLTSKEAASLMRGVETREISGLVKELNSAYSATGAPYKIVREGKGYRMTLNDSFHRLQNKCYGRIKEAKLSKGAVEVLAIVAYNQPTSMDAVNELRGSQSGTYLAQLVRRGLLKLQRPKESPARPIYSTTDRFLRLFSLKGLEDLPRSEQLEN